MDSDSGRPEGGEWLTAAELARRRRISKASADRLIRRRKWPKRRDNLTRSVRHLIPEHELIGLAETAGRPEDDRAPGAKARQAMETPGIAHHAALAAAVEVLRTELEARRVEAGALRAERDAGLVERDRARSETAAVRGRVEQLEQAEAARRSARRWARAWRAWRGE